MARIAALLEQGPIYSYEFSPPKNEAQAAALETTIDALEATGPDFTSLTYGALGSTRETTRDIAIAQNAGRDFPMMAHLTSVGQSREEVTGLIDAYLTGGLENILALRGDGDEPGAFDHAVDLAAYIKDRDPSISVGVAAHPEVHPASPSREQDLARLAEKLEVADFAITQFFFNADHYRRMVEALDALGSEKPVIPGIMLFASAAGLRRMAEMNNTELPKTLTDRLEVLESPEDIGKLAVETAAGLIDDLGGETPGLHIYTLNRSAPALALHEALT